MKKFRLLNLSLKNFKGVKKFDLQANGQDLDVFGDNGTGKTTLFDSFMWLLFNKDSQNKEKFSIKTLDNGEELHNLEHEVIGEFLINNTPLTLRKVYKEKWTKKQGAPIAEYTGNTTQHYVNGVPVKDKEYKAEIASIIQEDVFKLITSPAYFNEQMSMAEKRSTLLEICGDINNEDIILNNAELADLPTILKGRAIEDHRKVIAARKTEIKQELNMIPVRIDEINNSLPDNLPNVDALKTEVEQIETKLDENATLINNIRNGAVIIDRRQKLQQIEMELVQIKRDFESDSLIKISQLETRMQEERSNASILRSQKQQSLQGAQFKKDQLNRMQETRKTLLAQYHETKGLDFAHVSDCTCPTCGQDLPEEQVSAAREKALSEFNLKKSKKLESILSEGNERKAQIEKIELEISNLYDEATSLEEKAEQKDVAVAKLEHEISDLKSNVKPINENEEYTAKLNEKTEIENGIQKLKENADSVIADVEIEVAELKAKRSEINAEIAKYAQVEASKKRILELEKQQKDWAAEYEKLERELHLTDEFIRTKVNLLTEKINSKFKIARFKLFETQVNGGLKEICETTVEGVPYSTGLNNAARINVGIDIINTLTEHFEIQAPIFVDNAEAVTRLIDTDSQLISLVVSGQDKQLRIEKHELREAI